MQSPHRMHGSSASRDGQAVLLIGPPGVGKSDLVLRLLGRGFDLVADDQADIADGRIAAPAALAGLLEVRGLGILRLPHVASARLALVADLTERAERLPEPAVHAGLQVPLVHIDAHDKAYEWARNKRFEVHGMTGVFQVFDAEEVQAAAN